MSTDPAAEDAPSLAGTRVRRLSMAAVADVVSHAALEPRLAEIRARLGVPSGFPDQVRAEAQTVVDRRERRDRTDLPLVTIDPPGSMDLDQALHIDSLDGNGFVVWYAIADVAAFVPERGAIDLESRRRGVTLYAPDQRAPLHPAALSEDRASLLPGVDRPAVLWRLTLDPDGHLVETTVGRALVRSRRKLSYAEAQPLTGPSGELAALAAVGSRRQRIEAERGGVSLPLPEQDVLHSPDGFSLRYRAQLPVEGWNAQLSLLCGIAAAHLMLESGVGLLRTLPPASPDALATLRRQARALGVPWPDGAGYAEVVAGLDSSVAGHAAFAMAATALFRGASYQPLGVGVVVDDLIHGAIASPYADVTAPLRRLGDRFATEAVLAAVSGESVPDWVESALPELPALIQAGSQKASALDRAVIDLLECLVLDGRRDDTLRGVTVSHRRGGTMVQVAEPAVVALLTEEVPLGAEVAVRVDTVDLDRGVATLRAV